ncbi:MAG: hypothetical protein AAGA95_14840 [Pseudomonadota bacterium]
MTDGASADAILIWGSGAIGGVLGAGFEEGRRQQSMTLLDELARPCS